MSSEDTNKAMDEFCRLYKSAIVVFSTGVTAANVAEVISKILAIDGVAAVEGPALTTAGLTTVSSLSAFGPTRSLADAEATLHRIIDFFDGTPGTEGKGGKLAEMKTKLH